MANTSTISNLCAYTQYMCDLLEISGQFDVIYTDYLTRLQSYVYFRFTSFEFVPTSLVPQASNLSALLFLLYINEKVSTLLPT